MRLTVIGALCALILNAPALAQDSWPTRPIKITFAFPAGSDIALRAVSERLSQSLKQPIVVDYKPGAGGSIGAAAVSRAPADGYSFLQGADTMLTVNPHLYSSARNTAADLVPVTSLVRFNQTLACHPSTGIKTLQDLQQKAKEAKQPLTYASGGLGTPGHLVMELLLEKTRIKMTHIPYKGPAPAIQDMVAGQIACGFIFSGVLGPYVKAGSLNAIATSGSFRSPSMPDVPTVAQAGVTDFDATFTDSVFAPKDTPAAVIKRMRDEIAAILAQPEVRKHLLATDQIPAGDVPEVLATKLAEDSAKWSAIIQRLNLTMN